MAMNVVQLSDPMLLGLRIDYTHYSVYSFLVLTVNKIN
jgi:hypothetical protein